MEILNEKITGSGMGVELAVNNINNLDYMALRELTLQHKFVLIRNIQMNAELFSEICRKIGKLVKFDNNKNRYGMGEVFTLGGSYDVEKVLLGRGSVPLHTDGCIFDNQEDNILGFYCQENSPENPCDNITVISDQSALSECPRDIVDMIVANGVEYKVFEKGWFETTPEGWYRSPGIKSISPLRLHIAFPFDRKETKFSWKTRLFGVDEEKSRSYFEKLEAIFLQEQFCFRHSWRVGDFLLLDNYNTLHGRSKVSGNRKILNTHIS